MQCDVIVVESFSMIIGCASKPQVANHASHVLLAMMFQGNLVSRSAPTADGVQNGSDASGGCLEGKKAASVEHLPTSSNAQLHDKQLLGEWQLQSGVRQPGKPACCLLMRCLLDVPGACSAAFAIMDISSVAVSCHEQHRKPFDTTLFKRRQAHFPEV